VKKTIERIKKLSKNAEGLLSVVQSTQDLKELYDQFLGKKSEINFISKDLKNYSEQDRKIIGNEIHLFRSGFCKKIEVLKTRLEKELLEGKLKSDWMDVTKRIYTNKGSLHPLSLIQKKVELIFSSMGFEIADGPELETEWHNFDALNVPTGHPARDMQDTFWIKNESENSIDNFVLRTQTSNVQIREMSKSGAPIRIIAPGRTFRNEAIDASHDAMFYQVEGLLVDKDISLAHLKGVLESFLTQLFGQEVTIRLRPGYFPFVEPGLEVDFSCLLCKSQGCRVCKNSGWIEFMGAGMVHPNVLRNCNVDPDEFTGFAFGFGLTRLVMMKYEIDDIRLLTSQKKEFLDQF